METQIVKIDPQEYGLAKNEAQKIEEVFKPMLEQMTALEKEYNEIVALGITDEATKKARDLRLRYVKLRTGTAEIHKGAKAYYLNGGRFVDGWKNAQAFSASGKETELEKIEKHFELIEQEKKRKIHEARKVELAPYVEDVAMYGLKEMSESGYKELLESSKIAHQSRIDAEKKAEDDRIKKEIEDRKEQARIVKENEDLKKEADARDKALAIERKKAEDDKKKLEADQAAKLKAERDARDKVQAELAKRQEEESSAKRAEEEIALKAEADKIKAERAPDKKKLEQLAVEITQIALPTLQSDEAKEILKNCVVLLNKTSNYIKEQTINL